MRNRTFTFFRGRHTKAHWWIPSPKQPKNPRHGYVRCNLKYKYEAMVDKWLFTDSPADVPDLCLKCKAALEKELK